MKVYRLNILGVQGYTPVCWDPLADHWIRREGRDMVVFETCPKLVMRIEDVRRATVLLVPKHERYLDAVIDVRPPAITVELANYDMILVPQFGRATVRTGSVEYTVTTDSCCPIYRSEIDPVEFEAAEEA